jgi:hypothetical protein
MDSEKEPNDLGIAICFESLAEIALCSVGYSNPHGHLANFGFPRLFICSTIVFVLSFVIFCSAGVIHHITDSVVRFRVQKQNAEYMGLPPPPSNFPYILDKASPI